MATEILPTAGTAANSADLVVEAGVPVTVALKGVGGRNALVRILLRDDVGAYHTRWQNYLPTFVQR
ncbi:hypothetical protein [Rhizobium giardinii]|uniref:hypothetical protein n=1 Tax=Rhizobium giardinii TaxID=56731 RepID=UPI0039DF4146